MKTSPSKAAFEALNNAEKELKKKLKKLFPVEGKIVEVLKKKDAKFLISIGKSLGVKEDDKLLVIEKITVELEGKKVTREKEIGRLEGVQAYHGWCFLQGQSLQEWR